MPQKKCNGPIYFADQGIEVCESCGGCLCCLFDKVDHSTAEYNCFTNNEGICVLYAHAGRDCKLPPLKNESKESIDDVSRAKTET